jgi:hypothetical protein
MPERWIGIVVASDRVTAVDVEVPNAGPLVLQADHSWSLQQGSRANAYRVMHQQVADYLRENRITRAIIKASAVNRGGTTNAHLEAAELRGVVMSATATIAHTETLAKNRITRTFGTRKADEYLRDDAFWPDQITGLRLRVGSREAAMVVLATRNAQ